MIPAIRQVRLAGAPDSAVVRELDDAAFPPFSFDQRRAAPRELEDGVAAGEVFIAECADRPVGYLYVERHQRAIYVSGIAVLPDLQGQGFGSLLMDHMLNLLGDEQSRVPITTVASPRNLGMLRLLFSRSFVARWFLRDHFGPGHHRFLCQLGFSKGTGQSDKRTVWIPAAPLESVVELMESQRLVIRAMSGTRPSNLRFGLTAPRVGEFVDADGIGQLEPLI